MKSLFSNSCIYDNPQICPDVNKNSTKVTIHSNKCILIENFRCVLNVSKEEITVKAKKFMIAITGKSLTIDYYTSYEIKISGTILKVEYVDM